VVEKYYQNSKMPYISESILCNLQQRNTAQVVKKQFHYWTRNGTNIPAKA